MPYALVLDKLIKRSNLTVKEIAHKCQTEGANITASYISILRKPNNERTPSEDVSRALEKVLGASENTLVMEAYMDTAPEIIKKAVRNLQKRAVYTMLMATHIPDIENNQNEIVKMVETELDKQPLAELITKMAEDVKIEDYTGLPITATGEQNGEKYSVNLHGALTFPVQDDSMSPTIPQGSMVEIRHQPAYTDGDIIAFSEKGKEGIHYRQWSSPIENVAILTAFNSGYSPIRYDNTKMTILGKVTTVTVKL